MKIGGQTKTPPPNFKPIKGSIREPIILALAGVIRELREARGWNVGELAKAANLSRQGLCYFETHRRGPSASLVVRLGRALGVAPDVLFRQAQRRAAAWLADCEKCNYYCVENGRLRWLNPLRGCTRPGR